MNEEIDRELYKCLLDQETTFEKMLSLTREIKQQHISGGQEFDTEQFLQTQDTKKRPIYERLFQLATLANLKPRILDTRDVGFYRDKLVASTKSTKQRVDLYVEICAQPVSLNYPIETIKSDKIYIALSDNPEIFEYVRKRFSA